MYNFLQWSGFTLRSECALYWVGEVGQNPEEDSKKRRANKATNTMAIHMARNLAYYANLLNIDPLKMKK